MENVKIEENSERAQLAAELEVARRELQALQAEREQLSAPGLLNTRDGIFQGVQKNSRLAELLELIPPADLRVQDLTDRLEHIDKAESYERAVAEAPSKAQLAREAARAAEQRAGELAGQVARLRERAATLQSESDAAERQARNGEAVAAKKYAESIGGKQEQAALAALEKAQRETADVLVKVGSTAGVVAALDAQAEFLAEQEQDARSEAQSRYQAANEAGVTVARARWDEAVENLVEAGARLVEACSRASLETGLHKLFVPRFAPGQWPVDDDTLRKLAAETESADEAVEEAV